jgi:hypothetical protein
MSETRIPSIPRPFACLLVCLVLVAGCEPRHRPSQIAPPLAPTALPSASRITSKRSAAASGGAVNARDAGQAQVERPRDDELCAVPVEQRVSLDQAKPYAPSYPGCPPDNYTCDTIDAGLDKNDLCFVSNQNITRAERGIRAGSTGAQVGATAWDGTTRPRYLDRIDAHFHLTKSEQGLLRNNGFVVLDRLPYVDYAGAFHDIFQEQLPLYVGIDPILHAVFRGTELVLERIEKSTLKPALPRLLSKLRSGLRQARPRLTPAVASDLDLYLAVALGLAELDDAERTEHSLFGKDEQIRSLLELARAEAMTDPDTGIELFGRRRVVDFSQLTPRAHYAVTNDWDNRLDGYFRAVMWLSRLEFNLVSRSCRSSEPGSVPNPAETPREAADAIALAEIAQQSGALIELELFERIYGSFAGRREDVSMPELARLARRHGLGSNDPQVQAKLKRAIGEGYQRTARTHFMPQKSPVLPVIATLLGPRIVPDVAPMTRLVHDRTPSRLNLGAADVAYVLGHDRAEKYLAQDLKAFPRLRTELDRARIETRRGAAADDVYAHWLRAILAVGARSEGHLPSFFQREAYQDFRMNSALVGYGQLRHAFMLLAAQGYDAYGCEIPDAYVEPQLAVWDALLAHVRKVRTVVKGFAGLERVIGTLRSIAATELSGKALSDAEKRWLGMVSEYVPVGGYGLSGEPPKWTGWYYDLFEDREHGATSAAAFVADYFTLTNLGEVKYLGAEGPRLGVFIVDVGGVPRAMVGPVAKGYETSTPIEKRLDDEAATHLTKKAAAWRESYAAPVVAEPAIGLEGKLLACGSGSDPQERRFALRAKVPLGKVTVTLLDHHGDRVGAGAAVEVGTAWKVVAFALPAEFRGRDLGLGDWVSMTYGIDAVDIRVEDLAVSGTGQGAYEVSSSPSVFYWANGPVPELPLRWRGFDDIAIGLR